MKNLIILLLIPLFFISCSKPGPSFDVPSPIRFVLEDEGGELIIGEVTVWYLEKGEKKVIEDLEVEAFVPDIQKDTFATHWVSNGMSYFASYGHTQTYFLEYKGFTDTLTLIYEKERDNDFKSFQHNGKKVEQDMSKLWPFRYITINKK
ncbi:hypothetical protein [Nafulsella turpanensis]|uniref:hypothetical protein n=1 Tax=Nafulsella turpanensis TaxID=1265690 RepID=UPI00036E5B5E|nr:hypothetical protein [Nafulsella turpanensis]